MAAICLGLRRFQLVAPNAWVSGTSYMAPEVFFFSMGSVGALVPEFVQEITAHMLDTVSYTLLETWVEGALLSAHQNQLRYHEDVSMSGGQGS